MCAWSDPTTKSTGDTITAGTWNQDVKANPEALRGGGVAITSQAANDVVYASSATQLARLAAGTAGEFLQTNGAGSAPTWEAVSTTMSMLAKSGDYTVATSDGSDVMIVVDSSGGDVELTLYASSGQAGAVVRVKRTSGSNEVKLTGNASENIDGANEVVMITAAYASNSIVCDGTGWHNF